AQQRHSRHSRFETARFPRVLGIASAVSVSHRDARVLTTVPYRLQYFDSLRLDLNPYAATHP
ncbi:hypothetical protein AB4084_36780, partial [Lysobacter sp. 2RAB21]